MLGFLRKNKEENHTGISASPLPKKVDRALVWVDPAYRNAPSRILRAAALAQALHSQGVTNVTLACPYLPMIVFLIADLQHVDVTAEGSAKNVREALKQYQPQLVIADIPAPMQSPLSLEGPSFCQYGEKFQENLFSADLILIPGMIEPPNFEQMKLQPSRMADCIHGIDYVSLPMSYFNRSADTQEKKGILFVVSGNPSVDQVNKVLQSIKSVDSGSLKILHEGSDSIRSALTEEAGEENALRMDMSLEERIDIIDQSKVIITPPSPVIYEFLARGSAVIYYPGGLPEKSLCAYLEGQVLGIQWNEETPQEQLRNILQDNNHLETLRKKAKLIMKSDGPSRLAKLLVQRMEAWYALHG